MDGRLSGDQFWFMGIIVLALWCALAILVLYYDIKARILSVRRGYTRSLYPLTVRAKIREMQVFKYAKADDPEFAALCKYRDRLIAIGFLVGFLIIVTGVVAYSLGLLGVER